MLIVFPFCHRDANIALLQAKWIATLGGCQGHRALVAGSAQVGETPCIEIAGLLRAAGFDRVEHVVLPPTVEKGWPLSPNEVFKAVVRHLAKTGNKDPFYFFEPDCTPMRRDWLNKLITEYRLSGKPFMGAVVPTRLLKHGAEFVDGAHMVGTGIYPPDIHRHSTLWSFAENVPWDIYCQWEIVPHCRPTELIQHNWGTVEYKLSESGKIECEEWNEWGLAGSVREEAVVVHGCKDGSLIRLLMGGRIDEEGRVRLVAAQAPKIVQRPVVAPAPRKKRGQPMKKKRKVSIAA